MTDTTVLEQEPSRSPRSEAKRASVRPQKMARKVDRDRVASDALHARIVGVLQALAAQREILGFAEKDARPADPQLTVVFAVTRSGNQGMVTRNFFATYNPRLCARIPPEKKCASIVVTREMRDERIAERVLALFSN